MTKILWVTGDDDYGALTFEDSDVSVKQAFDLAAEAGGSYSTEIDGTSVNYEAFEFGEVDAKFHEFIANKVQDYDQSKDENYYIVKGDD